VDCADTAECLRADTNLRERVAHGRAPRDAAGVDDNQALAPRGGPRLADGPPFQGGLAGLACYELGARAEPTAPGERRLPMAPPGGREPGHRPRRQTPAIVFRPAPARRESSPATLRLWLTPLPGGVRVELVKSRGGAREPVELRFPWGEGE